jgi:hypothetical protein
MDKLTLERCGTKLQRFYDPYLLVQCGLEAYPFLILNIITNNKID